MLVYGDDGTAADDWDPLLARCGGGVASYFKYNQVLRSQQRAYKWAEGWCWTVVSTDIGKVKLLWLHHLTLSKSSPCANKCWRTGERLKLYKSKTASHKSYLSTTIKTLFTMIKPSTVSILVTLAFNHSFRILGKALEFALGGGVVFRIRSNKTWSHAFAYQQYLPSLHLNFFLVVIDSTYRKLIHVYSIKHWKWLYFSQPWHLSLIHNWSWYLILFAF